MHPSDGLFALQANASGHVIRVVGSAAAFALARSGRFGRRHARAFLDGNALHFHCAGFTVGGEVFHSESDRLADIVCQRDFGSDEIVPVAAFHQSGRHLVPSGHIRVATPSIVRRSPDGDFIVDVVEVTSNIRHGHFGIAHARDGHRRRDEPVLIGVISATDITRHLGRAIVDFPGLGTHDVVSHIGTKLRGKALGIRHTLHFATRLRSGRRRWATTLLDEDALHLDGSCLDVIRDIFHGHTNLLTHKW